jgi:hypothetical protein
MWRPRRQRREQVGFSSVAGRSLSRGIIASSRASRSGRSPTASDARQRPSRRISTTRPARRHGRSRRATEGCAGAAARTPSRETGKGTPTRTARLATRGRWTRARVLAAMREWRARYGRLPSSYDWSRTHARRRRAEALARLVEGDWPSASVVADVFGRWAAACEAAASEHSAVMLDRSGELALG